MAASLPRIAVPTGSSEGPNFFTAPSRLVEARLQAAWAFSPIRGQSARLGGGGGTRRVPRPRASASDCTASARLVPSTATGPMTIASRKSVRIAAANRRHPPSRAASHACTG